MKNTPYIAALALLILHVLGFLHPGALNWGFHSFAFLPSSFGIVAIVIAIAGAIWTWKGNPQLLLSLPGLLLSRRPLLFLGISIILFAAAAALLRVEHPLLGDSFILINNFINTFQGAHRLYIFREPVAIHFFYLVMRLLGTVAYPQILDAFLLAEVFLGSLFILFTFATIRQLVSDPGRQALSFLFILILPFAQLFFGYAEMYAAVLTVLALYLMSGILHLNGKLSFSFLPTVFLLMFFTHYLSGLLIPSLLFLAYREYRRAGIRDVVIGSLVTVIILTIVLWSVDFDPSRLIMRTAHSNILSFSRTDDGYQAYTLFSIPHLIELGNLLVLFAPVTCLAALAIATLRRRISTPTSHIFLAIAAIFPFMFFLVAKFDLGLAKDWDIPAPYTLIPALLGITLVFEQQRLNVERSFIFLLIITLLHSAAWFSINASGSASLSRASMLIDSRVVSTEGRYQSTMHLSMLHFHARNPGPLIALWQSYTREFPADPRGWENLAKSYFERGDKKDPALRQAFERWLELAPSDPDPRAEYSRFLADLGTVYLAEQNPRMAERSFREALSVNPGLAAAHNNLGYLFAQKPDSAMAIHHYEQAISLDPNYALAYKNLADLYLNLNRAGTALKYYEKAVSVKSDYGAALENMSKALYRIGDRDRAIASLKEAAKLGSRTAQSLLFQSGVRW